MKKLIVTGSSGLIGSEICAYFDAKGWMVHGVDNNQRRAFFGQQGDTRWMQDRLQETLRVFTHHELDVRDRDSMLRLMKELRPDAVVHAAAQPSHDLAVQIPFEDFHVNAVGTLNVLESVRQACPESPLIHLSTNKVYGDGPNRVPMREKETRWEFDDPAYVNGIPETFSIDQCLHSLFGASKVAADIMVQEYGRYFDMPTCCLRGGCLTGPNHCGVELHGFLSYLVKCNLTGKRYTVFGYKGKQVRDNIHSRDLARFVDAFIASPRSGAVYNIGGGKANSCSILEAFSLVEGLTGRPQVWEYVDANRIGDHMCYYSDLSRARADFADWDVTTDLNDTLAQIAEAWERRLRT